MFKLPIVALERGQGGRMFSIRDFRRLYKEVEKAELAALKKLFAVVFGIEPLAGSSFQQRVEARWASFSAPPAIPAIDALLVRLGIRRGDSFLKHAEFAGDAAASYFAQIVYAARNVIVHNTETEWHLSYATMDAPTASLLEDFLMPSLEEICFSLVGSPNNHVWYSNKNLALYS